MSTKEIRDFHVARYTCELADTFYISRHEINKILDEVEKLAQNSLWAPLQKDLFSLHKRLDEYRVNVCQKTPKEIEELRNTPLPETLKREFDEFLGYTRSSSLETLVTLTKQKMAEMLANPDFAPFHARLAILKMRVDEFHKKADCSLDQIDRIGIVHHITRITLPLFFENTSPLECPKDIEAKLLNGQVSAVQKDIENNPQIIFSRTGFGEPLNYCTNSRIQNQLPMVQLFIRAGNDVNNNRNLLIYAGKYLMDVNKRVLQLLLNAGADPNLPTRPVFEEIRSGFLPTQKTASGCSNLLHNLISRIDKQAAVLLPALVDAGMKVDAFEVACTHTFDGMANPITSIQIRTPLMHAISMYRGVGNDNRGHESLIFIVALIFNNATVHEEASRLAAQRKGCLEFLNKCVQIRESVLKDTLAPVEAYFPLEIAQIVKSYWTPNVPDMRERCYALIPIPVESEREVVKSNNS